MNIVLHQYMPLYGLPNASPFCIKLETYLRMAGLPHTVKTLGGPSKAPTGKAPYIEVDGQIICDSGVVVEYLERLNGHPVDGKLTLSERAVSLAMQRMLEEHLYWGMVYARWQDPVNEPHVNGYIRAVLSGAPGFVKAILVPLLKRSVRKSMHGHGLGRHSPETIWQLAIADVQAMAHWLGTRAWCFGDQPTVLDAVLFSFVGAIIRTPWDYPLKTATLKHRNLVDHTDRMLARYFPELAAAPSSV